MLRQLSLMLFDLIDAMILGIETLIERIGDPNGPAADRQALILSHERISELALEVEQLEGHNKVLEADLQHLETVVETYEQAHQKIAETGPALFEVENKAIVVAINLMDQDHVASWTRPHRIALMSLLGRCRCLCD